MRNIEKLEIGTLQLEYRISEKEAPKIVPRALTTVEENSGTKTRLNIIPEVVTKNLDDDLESFQELATSTNSYVLFGAWKQEGDDLYNVACLVDPKGGNPQIYKKMHLFGSESNYISPGDSPVLMTLDIDGHDVTINTLVCYDQNFFNEYVPKEGEPAPDLYVVISNFVNTHENREKVKEDGCKFSEKVGVPVIHVDGGGSSYEIPNEDGTVTKYNAGLTNVFIDGEPKLPYDNVQNYSRIKVTNKSAKVIEKVPVK